MTGPTSVDLRDHMPTCTKIPYIGELKIYMQVNFFSQKYSRILFSFSQRNSFGSVYFNEDLSEAQESLSNTLEQYSTLLEKLSDAQRQQVARTVGLKMEELKAQQNMIMETIKED